jgi:diaminohydroxyphosphoribosylaminopyrimidine deaminase / 5-amino-6-(5-phosphoribosylamino)uracil reductase
MSNGTASSGSTESGQQDSSAMRLALALAARGLGTVWPNPAVGCVILRDGRIVGRGWTQPGGRPHAETEALSRAGGAAAGSTAFVSLEPCCHHGATPPCTKALIAAGIKRVVAAVEDPDPRVSGQGIRRLREAGISVATGICESEASALNAGFFLRIRAGRPLVTLKLATTLDGRIATRSGESRWITGPLARARVHRLRATHDAVMVGSNTVLMDDPLLTCRLPGLDRASPVRIIVDSRLRVPLTSGAIADARRVPTWVVTLKGADPFRLEAFRACGVEIIETEGGENGLDIEAAFQELGRCGLTRILVEGGSVLAASLLRADLVDRLACFRAGCFVGGDGVPAIAGFGLQNLAEAPRFVRTGVEMIGEDVLETFTRRIEAE